MATKSINPVLQEANVFSRLWEDTIILALRDLQWRKAVRKAKKIEDFKKPSALLKLDGKAETAIGDAITSANDRFFIFEFKSGSTEAGTELEKPLAKIMKAVAGLPDTSAERQLFEQDTRAAHHFVFPEDLASAQDAQPAQALQQKRAIVATDCYYDTVVTMKKKHTMTNKVNIVDMLYPKNGNNVYGLDLYRMAAYIEYLTKRYTEWRKQEAANRGVSSSKNISIPMKALVYSTAGFFWPCADLRNLTDIVHLLHGHDTAVQVSARLIASGYPNPLPAFVHTFPPKKIDESTDKSKTSDMSSSKAHKKKM